MRHDITSVLKNPLIAYYNIFDSEKIAEFAAIAPAPSKDFYHLLITPTKICNSDSLWREIYVNTTLSQPSRPVEELAKLFGWKKLLFTSKLHLQMQLRRLTLEESDNNENIRTNVSHDPGLYLGKLFVLMSTCILLIIVGYVSCD
ncbi:uncharacterized protein DC041_0003609 [Schistosoma bovis]|uniref:Uncharacterized protein n=1 Tax=Schistosoma bovis TaxID=6184 RepID=A0A430QP24_SCHBO|nr:uncharacterized protein DC041_0003609 [Schistosoma bovis]